MSQTKIKNKTNQTKNEHVPVLLQQVLDVLSPKIGDSYLDLTAGYGGHAAAIHNLTQAECTLVDRDENAVAVLTKAFERDSTVVIRHQDFFQACEDLEKENKTFDLILADLGVSSPHLDNASRGFSILFDGPLDMRMDNRQELSAEVVVNTYDQASLERILRDYGEEPKARRMAERIIAARPITTTKQLAEIGKVVWPGHSRVHPATRLFQAIRIEVNDELGQLRRALPLMVDLLSPGGRLSIITFHSLEDRIVKQFFREQAGDRYDTDLVELTRQPLKATEHEIVINPRSRSAKVRAVERKIKTKRKG